DSSLAQGLEILFAGRRIAPGTGSFVDRIIPLSEFLDSVVSRDDFYGRSAAMNDVTDDGGDLQAIQKKILLEKLSHCRSQLEYALKLDGRLCSAAYATDYIHNEMMPVIDDCVGLLEKEKYTGCSLLLSELKFGTLRKKKDAELTKEQQSQIKTPIDRVKKELKSLADFALLSSEYAQQLAPQASLQTKVLMELLKRFDLNYAVAKRRRNVLDFSDLEHQTLALLENKCEVSAQLKKRFEHVFIDEYQDINAPQQRIMELLSRDDNVFVVGDIKQSIYGFRQSKPDIFLAQLKNASEIATASSQPGRVDLKDNFRCRKEVINFVNALFGRIMTEAVAEMEYDANAELVSGFDYEPFNSAGVNKPVELYLLDEDSTDDDQETDDTADAQTECISATQRQAGFIARRIQEIVGADAAEAEFQVYDKKIDDMRPVQYRDIVILLRSLSHKAQDYVEILRLAGVPVSSQSACGYFEATEIADCLCLLKVLDNPDRDIELAALLRSPIFNLSDSSLAAIRLHSDRKMSFYQAIKLYAQDGDDPSLRGQVSAILSEISDWRRRLQTGSLAGVLDEVYRMKQLPAFYSALPNGAQRRANLLKLHDHAIQFEHFRTTEPGAALGRFVEFLEKLAEAQQDWAPAEADSAAENAVRIMSVHKSKGLEFPVVFVAELNTPFNTRDASGECLVDEDTVGLQIPDAAAGAKYPSMAHQVIAERKRKDNLAEEMRILYVALTRAREKLILTASRKEKACANLLTQCGYFTEGLPDWKLGDVRCHLDWILSGFSAQRQLRTLYAIDVDTPLADDGLFHAGRVNRDDLNAMTNEILDAKRSLKSFSQTPDPGSAMDSRATEAFETIKQNFAWSYAFNDVTMMNAKISVSQLTHRDDEFAAPDMRWAFTQKPAVLSDMTGRSHMKVDALSLGSAVHLIMEHVDLTRPVDIAVVQSTADQLVDQGKLGRVVADAVDQGSIAAFFAGTLGQLAIQNGDAVLREWPFTFALDAAEVGATSTGEIVVLQGIVDMIVPTKDGLVIIDFKTDRVDDDGLGQRAEGYADQLRSYGKAAAGILKQPVASAWLYFLSAGKAIEVDL
ncbi:MAG: 3'-5' exonuclease, partial [Planctomycetota bacterium]